MFPRPRTTKDKFDEFDRFATFIIDVFGRPVWMILRWPLWPLWARQHPFERFSDLGIMGFQYLCMFGCFAQMACVYYLVGEPLLRGQWYIVSPFWAWLSVGAFVSLTLVRIGVWVYDELVNT